MPALFHAIKNEVDILKANNVNMRAIHEWHLLQAQNKQHHLNMLINLT